METKRWVKKLNPGLALIGFWTTKPWVGCFFGQSVVSLVSEQMWSVWFGIKLQFLGTNKITGIIFVLAVYSLRVHHIGESHWESANSYLFRFSHHTDTLTSLFSRNTSLPSAIYSLVLYFRITETLSLNLRIYTKLLPWLFFPQDYPGACKKTVTMIQKTDRRIEVLNIFITELVSRVLERLQFRRS